MTPRGPEQADVTSGNSKGLGESPESGGALSGAESGVSGDLDANDGELIKTLVQTAIDKALSGDFRYWKAIIDRVDGKVTDKVQHSGRIDSMFAELKFEDMSDEQLARHMRTAGIAGTD